MSKVEENLTIKDQLVLMLEQQLDGQNEKGMKTYGQTLDDCPPEDYDWQQMLNEELIDALQYQQKEIRRLRGLLAFNPNVTELMHHVHIDVVQERVRQNNKWGLQRHPHGDWLAILMEEVGEVAQAMQKVKGWGKSTDADNLYEELIHTSAVASAMAEQVWEEIQKKS